MMARLHMQRCMLFALFVSVIFSGLYARDEAKTRGRIGAIIGALKARLGRGESPDGAATTAEQGMGSTQSSNDSKVGSMEENTSQAIRRPMNHLPISERTQRLQLRRYLIRINHALKRMILGKFDRSSGLDTALLVDDCRKLSEQLKFDDSEVCWKDIRGVLTGVARADDARLGDMKESVDKYIALIDARARSASNDPKQAAKARPAPATRESISQCSSGKQIASLPRTISVSGVYCLTQDVVLGAPGTAITVLADDVTIDLRGFQVVTATAASTAFSVTGKRVKIKNGGIRGFRTSIELMGAIDWTIEDIVIYDPESNAATVGITTVGAADRGVVRNVVARGDATSSHGIVIGAAAADVQVRDVIARDWGGNGFEISSIGSNIVVWGCSAIDNTGKGFNDSGTGAAQFVNNLSIGNGTAYTGVANTFSLAAITTQTYWYNAAP